MMSSGIGQFDGTVQQVGCHWSHEHRWGSNTCLRRQHKSLGKVFQNRSTVLGQNPHIGDSDLSRGNTAISQRPSCGQAPFLFSGSPLFSSKRASISDWKRRATGSCNMVD